MVYGSKTSMGDSREPSTVRFDVETRSLVDLKKVGPWVYAKHPSTELLVLKYAVGNGPLQTFIPDMFNGCRAPEMWCRLASSPTVHFEAFNTFFEWCIYNFVLVERYGWPSIPIQQWRCAMATSCYFALPRALDGCAADALQLPYQKDKEGHRIMLKLSKPRKPTKNNPATYHAKPEDFEKLYSYCGKDVEAHRAIANHIGELPPDELLIWQIDQLINRRGVHCDVEAVRGAITILDQVMGWYVDQVKELTGGEVQTINQTAKMQAWCAARGVHLDNMQAGTIEDVLDNGFMVWSESGEYAACELPPEVRTLLSIRQAAGKSSIAKFQAMLDRVDFADNRIRSTLVYHGASTGRWSGSGIQPQNYPRGTFKFKSKKNPDAPSIETVVALTRARDIDGLKELGDVPAILSSALRSMLCAAPGKKLIAADYSSIEARILFWLTGEERGLDIFRTTGLVYEDMAATIHSVPLVDVDDDQRFIGKQAVLGLGYQMGWEKFQKQCAGYGVTISKELANHVVDAYRGKYARVKQYWEDVNTAAVLAVQSGQPVNCGKVTFFMQGEFLRIRLPSGRCISYHKPHFVPARFNPNELAVAYWGMDSQKHKWCVQNAYGGKWTENIVQAIAGCVLRFASVNLESNGYPIVMSVHDELVTETENTPAYNIDTMVNLMCALPQWAYGLPLKADGWEGQRFKK